jgi:hypothetical protein
MRHSPRLLALCAIVLSSACKQTTTTPSGTDVLRWDKSKATRPSVPSAKELGPRTSKDFEIIARPEIKGPLTLKLHVETGPLEILEDGKTYRHTSPLSVRVAVDTNADWTVTGKCHDGPHYQLGPLGAGGVVFSPEAMLLSCDLPLRYVDAMKDLSLVVRLHLLGDGSVTADMSFGKVTVDDGGSARRGAELRPQTPVE